MVNEGQTKREYEERPKQPGRTTLTRRDICSLVAMGGLIIGVPTVGIAIYNKLDPFGFNALRGSRQTDEQVGIEKKVVPIDSVEDFERIREYPDYYFRITRDLDFGSKWFEPIAYFNGTLDGEGHTITGFKQHNESKHSAIFSRTTSKAKILNLNLKDVDIHGGVGLSSLVNLNEGIVYQCTISGKLYVEWESGGLVNFNSETGSITDSNFFGEVISNCAYSRMIGGIASSNRGKINGCKFSGYLNGVEYIGGITGVNHGSVSECDVKNSVVEGKNYTGPLIGHNLGKEYGNSFGNVKILKPN